MSTPIDLSQLPAPNVIESLDYETILAERKAALIALYPVDEQSDIADKLELESEPLTKLLQENAYRELVLRQRINESARAVMLAFSAGSDLDQIGANYDVERLVLDEGDPDAVPPVDPTYESDSEYRYRIQLAFESLSVAGPDGAYEFQARAAHADVLDVSVASPEPVDVVVTILSRQGDGIPGDDVLEAVASALDERRPLTDRVTVNPATLIEFGITAELVLRDGPDPALVESTARQRLEAYVENRHRLGAWITRSGIDAALTVEGVERVTLADWADIQAEPHQAPTCTAITVTAEVGA